jgi:uncharacterized membrane protein YgcG
MIGLLALAGLAIDGGNLVMERRRAQNAADAAALAGTRLLSLAMMTCDPIDVPALDDKIASTVNEYAEKNGISDTDGAPGNKVNSNVVAYYVNPSEARLGTVGAMGTVPMEASGVEVELQDQHRTYFMVVVGIRSIPSSAEAMAMAGVLKQIPAGSKLIPVAVPQVVVETIEDAGGDPDWEMHDTGDNLFCYTDDDGIEHCPMDPDAPHEAQRGWLNLNHIYNAEYEDAEDVLNRTYEQSPSVESDKCEEPLPGLKGYAAGCTYPRPIYAGHSCYGEDGLPPCDAGLQYMDGDFIHGSDGSESAAMHEIYDNLVGEVAYAPVFDRVFTRGELEAQFDSGAESPTNWPSSGYSWPTGGGFATGGGGSDGSWYYHVVGWVAATVGNPGKDKNSVLRGAFLDMSVGYGELEIAQFGGPCSLMMHGVTLWH